MPTSQDIMVIFVLTTTTMMTQPITLPLVHMHGAMNARECRTLTAT